LDLGTHLNDGSESLKAVTVEYLSRQCAKCKQNKVHPFYVCSKNYEGSSKGMEAEGALQNVRLLLYNQKEVFIETFTMDDHSSTKSILRHSWKLMVDSGILGKLDWPRTASGAKGGDGQLPLLHPIINSLADKNHCVCTYTRYFFLLAHNI
jgi:hypothetical protein